MPSDGFLKRKYDIGEYVLYPQDDEQAEGRIEGIAFGFGGAEPSYLIMPNEHQGEIVEVPESRLEAL
jgi:hypothetical protein